MPQRSLASLVLAPLLIGVLCLALACVAGARTDRLADTLTATDTLRAIDSARVADTLRKIDSTRSADADSAAASQLAVVVDSATLKQGTPTQQGSATKGGTPGKDAPSSCCTATLHLHRHGEHPLSPAADSIANGLVFVPVDRAWFQAASRGKHMLVDIGRIDLALKSDTLSRAAYQEAVTRLSPLPLGTMLRIRAPYGVDEQAKIVGFDSWHGRIVAKLSVSHLLDSLARAEDMLPATATRIDTAAAHALSSVDSTLHATTGITATPAVTTPPIAAHADSMPPPAASACVRDTLPTDVTTRAIAVRDSLVRFLTDSAKPPYERQIATAKVQSWWVPGCFGVGRALIVVNKRTPEMDFAVERVALLDSTGRAVPVRVVDLRFHAHDPLYVFDADGDGIDDLASRAHGDRSGGLTIMRLDLATRRFVRLVSGFAWEQ
ncbi:MAG TPA: hypothetical protein VJO33_04840 [Gemmatimonadaceae bacterium]|nr:hypothetical protein [Gemmatimonadaceae bacterium]